MGVIYPGLGGSAPWLYMETTGILRLHARHTLENLSLVVNVLVVLLLHAAFLSLSVRSNRTKGDQLFMDYGDVFWKKTKYDDNGLSCSFTQKLQRTM